MRGAFVVLLLFGCGAAATPPLDLREVFGAERAAVARQEAPDLYARAERARAEAERAHARGEHEAAQDHATRARLLLEAAIVEAERAALERERLDALQAAEEATRAAAAAEAARHELERAQVRARAAELARSQVQAALAQAEEDEARRFRRRGSEIAAARRRAAVALRDRVRLLLAAARALGADSARLAEVEASVARLEGDPAEVLRRVDQAYAAAMALLGEARATHPVDEAVRGSLLHDAREHGFEVEVRAEAVAIRLGRRPTRVQLHALATIARAYPHGPLRLQGPGARPVRARLIEAGIEPERVEAAVGGDGLELLLPAYGAPR